MNANRCRLCLGHTTQYINIFQKDSFSEMIHILSGIKVDPEDGLPSIACLQCHQEVKSAMLTRYQIINSNKTLCEELQFSTHTDIKIDYDDEPIGSDCEVDNSFDMIEVETELTEEECCEDNRNSPINVIKFKRKPLGDKVDRKKRKPAKVQFTLSVEHEKFLKGIKRNDRVACLDCGKVLFGVNMKNHLYTHKYDPVICDMCGKTSKNAQALQDHINYYHKTTIDRFVCDKCGRCFRVRCALEKHELKEHGSGEKSCECSICGKKFFEQAQLKNHIKITHNKIKSYKCEHCGKDFGRRTQFVTHQLVHSKLNRYHCQVCGKGFKIKQTMQTHLKGVHGIEEEKTIFCDICHKGFSSQNGLRAHINSRVHGLEKCEHCSEYITLEFKSVHLKEMHGLKPHRTTSKKP